MFQGNYFYYNYLIIPKTRTKANPKIVGSSKVYKVEQIQSVFIDVFKRRKFCLLRNNIKIVIYGMAYWKLLAYNFYIDQKLKLFQVFPRFPCLRA